MLQKIVISLIVFLIVVNIYLYTFKVKKKKKKEIEKGYEVDEVDEEEYTDKKIREDFELEKKDLESKYNAFIREHKPDALIKPYMSDKGLNFKFLLEWAKNNEFK